MQIMSYLVSIILAAYLIREVVQFAPMYKQLKRSIANNDPQARVRVYKRALTFECVSALLALVALRFDWNKLNPASLDLSSISWIQHLHSGGDFDRGALTGILTGVIAGTVGFFVMRLKAKKQIPSSAPDVPAPKWRKLMPDFSALIPVTRQERMLWIAVALSAGICEEIVFRGWLMTTLHSPLALHGAALLLAGGMIFGLAHSYQGISGVVLTSFAGAFFCVLYVATGSLLIPIVLHCVIDARFAILPAPFQPKPQVVYSQG